MTPPADNLTRRDALGVGLSGMAALMTDTTLEAADSKDFREGFIDSHSHVWTPDVEQYPLTKGKTKADLAPQSFTAEELLAIVGKENVSRVVLIQHIGYHGFDNNYMIDMARQHAGRFSIVAAIDENMHRPQDVIRILKKQAVRGFRIRPEGRGDKWLDGDGMAAMWKCAAEENLAMCTLLKPAELAAVDRMCQKFPETPVVVDHFGGAQEDSEVDTLCRLAQHKRVHVKVSAFYAHGKKQPPYEDLAPKIRRVLEAFGPKRLMWGSDCPYQLEDGNTYAASVALLRDRLDFLTKSDRAWLLRKTAEKVFFT